MIWNEWSKCHELIFLFVWFEFHRASLIRAQEISLSDQFEHRFDEEQWWYDSWDTLKDIERNLNFDRCENNEKIDKEYEKKNKCSYCDRWVIYEILKIKFRVKYFH